MPNDTTCSPTSNCTILGGTTTNGTLYTASFDPNAPAPLWHQRMELATIVVCNSLTCKDFSNSFCFMATDMDMDIGERVGREEHGITPRKHCWDDGV